MTEKVADIQNLKFFIKINNLMSVFMTKKQND